MMRSKEPIASSLSNFTQIGTVHLVQLKHFKNLDKHTHALVILNREQIMTVSVQRRLTDRNIRAQLTSTLMIFSEHSSKTKATLTIYLEESFPKCTECRWLGPTVVIGGTEEWISQHSIYSVEAAPARFVCLAGVAHLCILHHLGTALSKEEDLQPPDNKRLIMKECMMKIRRNSGTQWTLLKSFRKGTLIITYISNRVKETCWKFFKTIMLIILAYYLLFSSSGPF